MLITTISYPSENLSALYLQYDRDQYVINAAVSDSSDKSKDPKDQKVMLSLQRCHMRLVS